MPTPSLILVPARFKTGKLYTPVATTSGGTVLGASGDFNVTRATSATRVNASGNIEVVASGIPRLDYFGSSCPALLVEPSAANGILNSDNTATSWLLGANLSSGYVDVIGVSGNNLTIATSGSNLGSSAGVIRRANNNVALASGSTYTLSFLMKKTGAHTIGGYWAIITGGAAGNLGGGFDVSGSFSSGSLYNTAGTTNRIRRIEQWGTDVYRCSETFTMTASGTLTQLAFAPITGVTNVDNPATGSTMAFAAPQVELGAVPTTFIPTTTAAVTRNADVVAVSGAVSGSIGQTEGTIYAEVNYDRTATTKTAIMLINTDGSFQNRIQLYTDSSHQLNAIFSNASTAQTVNASGTNLQNGINKIALTYTSSSAKLFLNGALQQSFVLTIFPAASLQVVKLGNNFNNSLPIYNGLRAAALYTTMLSDAELAALTTP